MTLGASGSGWVFIEPLPCTEDVKDLLLDAARASSSKTFAEKYSARNRGVVPVTAARSFEALEKFLVTGREDVLVVCSRHDKHTEVRPLDCRRALAAEYRIIIACCWSGVKTLRLDGGCEAVEPFLRDLPLDQSEVTYPPPMVQPRGLSI